MRNLENEFEELLQASFETLRIKYMDHELTKEEAESLHYMLETKLAIKDLQGALPEEGWQRSSWCLGG